ncbi:MAG: hypothetical protein DDT37_02023 [Firmicutes bacterium]|nr:hypothetical protein [candidate division NPL-UPA2 bacterium]
MVRAACASTCPLVAISAATAPSTTCARPAASRMIILLAVAADTALCAAVTPACVSILDCAPATLSTVDVPTPCMPVVAGTCALAAASVVAGASHQVAAPVIAVIRLASQETICRTVPDGLAGGASAWSGAIAAPVTRVKSAVIAVPPACCAWNTIAPCAASNKYSPAGTIVPPRRITGAGVSSQLRKSSAAS